MAKGRLCISFNFLIFGRVFLEVSFLASFSFVGASDLSLYVFQSSCVSPYIITPPVSASRKLCHLLKIYIFFRGLSFCLTHACPPLLSRRRGRRGIMEWWNVELNPPQCFGALSITLSISVSRGILPIVRPGGSRQVKY